VEKLQTRSGSAKETMIIVSAQFRGKDCPQTEWKNVLTMELPCHFMDGMVIVYPGNHSTILLHDTETGNVAMMMNDVLDWNKPTFNSTCLQYATPGRPTNIWMIVGITVGVIAFIAILAGVFHYRRRLTYESLK
jgi:hypothetical protein